MNLQQRRAKWMELAGQMFDLLACGGEGAQTPQALRMRHVSEQGRPHYPTPTKLARAIGMDHSLMCRYERDGCTNFHEETVANARKIAAAIGVREDQYLNALREQARIARDAAAAHN